MSDMLQRLAEAERFAVETDAPEPTPGGEIPYDTNLQVELLEWGPETLKTYGAICVRGASDPKRYNTAVWYALGGYAQPGEVVTRPLSYELKNGCVYITDPDA